MTDASSMHAGICCIAIDSPPAQHAAARQVGAGDGGHAGVFAGRCTAHRSPLRTLGAMNAEEPAQEPCWVDLLDDRLLGHVFVLAGKGQR